jgi:hypothetical protein
MSRVICAVFLSLTLVTTCAKGQHPDQFPPEAVRDVALRNPDNFLVYRGPQVPSSSAALQEAEEGFFSRMANSAGASTPAALCGR